MHDRNRPLYMIGVAAELAHVHPQTLRMYEQKGLVIPKRTSGNTRMYSQADVERLLLINELTEEGINLAGVLRILALQESLEERDQEIERLHQKMRRLVERMHDREIQRSVVPRPQENDCEYPGMQDLEGSISVGEEPTLALRISHARIRKL